VWFDTRVNELRSNDWGDAMPPQTSSPASYIESINLDDTPRWIVGQGVDADAGNVFKEAKDQAQVVGSGLFSFAQGVTPEIRDAVSNSALLAQLVANKEVKADDQPLEWFTAYEDVLANVGWAIQSRAWNDYTEGATAAEVHEKIIDIITVALGPSVAALALIKSAIDVLKAMNPDTPWLTIFSREAQHATIARFQVGLVEPGPNDDVMVTLLACLIKADTSVTQVLVFKFREARASFQANSTMVSINDEQAKVLLPKIRAKVRAYQTDYVSSIKDL
jgi:hypothetical protein